jgi:conjugative relaxase-like TrwC/TraI family protein
MLVLRPVSVAGVPYWQRSAVHSVWLGRGAESLGLSGEVGAADLRRALLGGGPGAQHLTPRPALRRRHGWDLVLAAPKSVSLLTAALAPGPHLDLLREAHRRAVTDSAELLESCAAWGRHAGQRVRCGIVAASFEHATSNSGDPHLHSHVVLANLGLRAEGGWGCLDARELWRWREAIGAGFQLALRARLNEAGLGLNWELSAGGAGEISAVPAQARRSASSRSRALLARGRWSGSVSAAASRAAQGLTRRALQAPAASAGKRWGGDWGPARAASVVREALAIPAVPSPPPSPQLVAEALAARASSFREPDVLVALAETSPRGCDLREAVAWSRYWCMASESLGGTGREGTGAGRWTSPLARALDQRVVDAATQARSAHLARVSPVLAERELAELGVPDQLFASALSLACGSEGVAVVPWAPWLAQAACIDAARAAWQAAGAAVAVSCPTTLSARRWQALTSLRPPGAGPWAPNADAGPGPRVLVVDAADHLSPRALADLVERAGSSGTKLVLVAGGTVPGRDRCLAQSLDQLLDELCPVPLQRLPSPALGAAVNRCFSLSGAIVRGALTGTDAMAHVVSSWRTATAGTRGLGPAGAVPSNLEALMVAFGPAEAEALNLAARAMVLGGKEGAAGPQLRLGGREYATGDRVLALRRIGEVRSATPGTVVAAGRAALTIEWAGATGAVRSRVGPGDAENLGYGYATTVPYLRGVTPGGSVVLPGGARAAGPRPGRDGQTVLLVLGDHLELGARSAAASGAWVTVGGPGPLGRTGLPARRRAAIIELATSWPDEEVLGRAGPRPFEQAAAKRWAGLVASLALARAQGLERSDERAGGVRARSARPPSL